MTTSQFLEDFQSMLQRDEPVSVHEVLNDMEEWDSLALMAAISFFDLHFEIRLTFETLGTCRTVGDVMALTQDKLSDCA